MAVKVCQTVFVRRFAGGGKNPVAVFEVANSQKKALPSTAAFDTIVALVLGAGLGGLERVVTDDTV